MTTHVIDLGHGADAHVTVSPTVQGIDAHALIFDEDANVIGETSSRQYIDYCDACVCASEIARAMPVLAGEASELVALADLECKCE